MAVNLTELVDLTEVAMPLGIKCKVAMFASLAEHVEAARLLERLRDALVATERDPALAPMRAVVLHGEPRTFSVTHETIQQMMRFMARARAGIGGLTEAGDVLAMTIQGRYKPVMVVFTLWRRPHLVSELAAGSSRQRGAGTKANERTERDRPGDPSSGHLIPEDTVSLVISSVEQSFPVGSEVAGR